MTVGGAQRTQRKRNQQKQSAAAARAVAAARGTRRDSLKIIIGVIVIVLIAGAVVGGVIYTKHKSDVAAEGDIPALTVAGSTKYPTSFDKNTGVVTVGQPGAKVTVAAYEDFLCPICGDFESTNFTDVEKQLEAGNLKMQYHMLNLLDNDSSPAGYSMLAANTALAIATTDPSKFMDFHYSLYKDQPKEGAAGWTQVQLTNLAGRLGVKGTQFDNLVNNKTYNQVIQTNMNNANNNKALYQSGQAGFGTPTIVPNGKAPIASADWEQGTGWLDNLIKAAYPS
jgi:protein-disulfide isomerase